MDSTDTGIVWWPFILLGITLVVFIFVFLIICREQLIHIFCCSDITTTIQSDSFESADRYDGDYLATVNSIVPSTQTSNLRLAPRSNPATTRTQSVEVVLYPPPYCEEPPAYRPTSKNTSRQSSVIANSAPLSAPAQLEITESSPAAPQTLGPSPDRVPGSSRAFPIGGAASNRHQTTSRAHRLPPREYNHTEGLQNPYHQPLPHEAPPAYTEYQGSNSTEVATTRRPREEVAQPGGDTEHRSEAQRRRRHRRHHRQPQRDQLDISTSSDVEESRPNEERHRDNASPRRTHPGRRSHSQPPLSLHRPPSPIQQVELTQSEVVCQSITAQRPAPSVQLALNTVARDIKCGNRNVNTQLPDQNIIRLNTENNTYPDHNSRYLNPCCSNSQSGNQNSQPTTDNTTHSRSRQRSTPANNCNLRPREDNIQPRAENHNTVEDSETQTHYIIYRSSDGRSQHQSPSAAEDVKNTREINVAVDIPYLQQPSKYYSQAVSTSSHVRSAHQKSTQPQIAGLHSTTPNNHISRSTSRTRTELSQSNRQGQTDEGYMNKAWTSELNVNSDLKPSRGSIIKHSDAQLRPKSSSTAVELISGVDRQATDRSKSKEQSNRASGSHVNEIHETTSRLSASVDCRLPITETGRASEKYMVDLSSQKVNTDTKSHRKLSLNNVNQSTSKQVRCETIDAKTDLASPSRVKSSSCKDTPARFEDQHMPRPPTIHPKLNATKRDSNSQIQRISNPSLGDKIDSQPRSSTPSSIRHYTSTTSQLNQTTRSGSVARPQSVVPSVRNMSLSSSELPTSSSSPAHSLSSLSSSAETDDPRPTTTFAPLGGVAESHRRVGTQQRAAAHLSDRSLPQSTEV